MSEDSSTFLIEILVDLIDRAGPGLAKLAAEIEALKKVAGAETVRSHPTAGLDQGLQQTTESVDKATTSLDKQRQALDRASQATQKQTSDVRQAKTALDDYSRSADTAGDKEAKLAEQAERLDAVMGNLQDSFNKQTTLTRQQEVEAQRLAQEYSKLARAYEVGTEEARQYALQSKAVQDILNESKSNLAAYTAQQVANANAVHDIRMQQQRDTDAQLLAIQKEQAAHQQLVDRITNTQRRYDSFTASLRKGTMDTNAASIGYRQMARELDGIARSFDPASSAAIKFAYAARMARDEAARLILTVGDGGGGGGLGALLTGGGGGGGRFTPGLRYASAGSLGAFAGLGLEHLLMTGIGLAGSAAGALGGGALLGGASLATTAVGGGADAAVMKSTISDTSALYKTLQTNTQNVALAQAQANAAVAQYGKNSQQAATAQQNLAQAQTAANAQLKFQMSQLGPGAGAELALAKQVDNLNKHWDNATGNARKAATTILGQLVGVAYGYVQLIANAATRNFKIIDAGLRPLFQYIEGPGKKIFNDLENIFAARLPKSVHAFVQAFELVSKIIDYVANTFLKGGFITAVDNFFTKWNDPGNWNKVTHLVDHLVGLFETWKNFLEILVKDIYQIFHADAGTAQSIVTTLTQMLDKLHDWLTSTRGQQQLHTIFEVHKQEAIALLNLLVPLIEGFGRFYMIVAPPLTKAVTLFLELFTKILDGFVNLGTYVGGPFKTLWNDGVLIPFGAFLVAWKAWDFSTAISRFSALGKAVIHPLSMIRQLGGALKALATGNFGGAWTSLKNAFGGGAAATGPAAEMRLAFEEGGAAAAAAIREAMISGGGVAGVEIRTAEVTGAVPAGFVRGSGGIIAPAAAGAGSGAAAGGVAIGAGSIAAVLGTFIAPTVVAALFGGGPSHGTTAPGLASLLGPVGAQRDVITGAPGQRGGGVLTQSVNTATTSTALKQLQTELKGITDPAQLSTSQLHKLEGQIITISNMPDLTTKQRTGLNLLAKQLDPVNAAVVAAGKLWDSTFSGINATTGNVLTQVKQVVQTNIANISTNLGTGTVQGSQALVAVMTGAYQTIAGNTNLAARSVQNGLVAINTLMNNALKSMGAPALTGKDMKTLGPISTMNWLQFQAAGGGTGGGAAGIGHHATGGYESARPGGKIIQVAEGGYPEVVLTTDPKHAKRQRALLAQYLSSAPHVLQGSYAAGGTIESYGQLESLWDQAGGPPNMAALMAAIAEAESTGAVDAHNPSGASGLWQILGLPFPGNVFDPLTNAKMAVSKWRSQGLGAWATYTSGAYKQFLKGGIPPGALGSSGAAQTITQPKWSGPGGAWSVLGGAVLKNVTAAANAFLSKMAPSGAAGVPFGAPGGSGAHGAYSALHLGRTDQGVDFGGQGRVDAVLPGTVMSIGLWPGWPGTGGVVYKTARGNVYVMEDFTPGVQPGQQLTGGQFIGTAMGGPSGIETGWANAAGTGPLTRYNGHADGTPMPGGISFRQFLGYKSGGIIPAAGGFHGIVDHPTMFLAGEGGASEHVAITPAQTGGMFGGIGTAGSAGLAATQLNISLPQVMKFIQILAQLSAAGQTQSISPKDISRLITLLSTGLHDVVGNFTKFMNYLGQITAQGGPLDQLDQAVQAMFTQASNKIVQSSIFVNKQGLAVQRETPAQQDAATIGAYRTEYRNIGREQKLVDSAKHDVLSQLASGLHVSERSLASDTPLQIEQLASVRASASDQHQITENNKSISSLNTQLRVAHNETPVTSRGRRDKALKISLIQKKISELKNQNKHLSPAAQANKLALQYGNLVGRSQTLSGESAQALESLYQAEGTELSDQMSGIQNTLGLQSQGLQGQVSTMQNRGFFGKGQEGVSVTNQLVSNAQSQITAYTKVLQKAQAEGNKDVAAQAEQQIQQLNQSIADYTTQLLQAQVEYFTQQSQYQNNVLQRRTSFAQNVVAKGVQGMGGAATTIAAQLQYGVLQQTGADLRGQLAQARGFLHQANEQGNLALSQQLSDQIGQLTEQIAENTQALSDQTVAIRQTTIDWINRVSQFQTGVFGSLYGALQTIGAIQGGLNVPAAIGVTQGSINALQGAQGGLISQLSGMTGGAVNLQGLSGVRLIQALTSLPISQLESGMTAAQTTQFEGLIGQIASNEAALETNTQQLMTLNGQLMQPQSFSSTMWSSFRAAMFTGMGALLPQFSNPASGSGIGVPFVPGSASISSTNTQNINVNLTNPTQTTDPRYLGAAIAWHSATSP
jgi:hypothetical protein